MQQFFTFYLDELPEGAGFLMYGPEHILFLAAIAFGVIATCIAYRRTRPEKQATFRRIVSCICFALEFGKQVLLLITLPSYPVSQLTLHLCGLGIFVQMVDAFVPRWPSPIGQFIPF